MGDKIEKMKGWGRVLGTTETYTKVPTPSGLIEETVKIVKIISYLFNFPSHLSPILTQMQLFYQQMQTLNADLLFSKNGYFEAVNIQIMHSVSRSGSL